MKLINRLERAFRQYAIPNLTMYIVAFQALTCVLAQVDPYYVTKLVLDHDLLFAGQWWRLITMVVIPPSTSPIWAFFDLYFFYVMGTALEREWGAFRYNLYLLIGYLCTLLVALIPGENVTNIYLLGSVLLAFAWLYPDFVILLFLIIPTKMKWLGLGMWIIYLAVLLDGDPQSKAEVGAGIISFLIFFHGELWQWARTSKRKFQREMAETRKMEEPPVAPVHVCTICGVSLKTDPRMEFRYCPQCTGTPCYCIHHINNHVHR